MADKSSEVPHHETLADYGKIDDQLSHVVNYTYEKYLTIVCVQCPPKNPAAPAGDGSKDHVFHNLLVTRYMVKLNDESWLPDSVHFLVQALFVCINDALLAANFALVEAHYLDAHYLHHVEYGDHHLDHPQRHKVVLPNFTMAHRDTHGLGPDELLSPEHHPAIKISNEIYEVYCVQVPHKDDPNHYEERYMIKWKDEAFAEPSFKPITHSALCYTEEESIRLALLGMKKDHWYQLVPHADLISYACDAYFIAKLAHGAYIIVWASPEYCNDPDLLDNKYYFWSDFEANEAAELHMSEDGWHTLSAIRHDDHYLKYGYPFGLTHDDFMHIFEHEHPEAHHDDHHDEHHDEHHDDHHDDHHDEHHDAHHDDHHDEHHDAAPKPPTGGPTPPTTGGPPKPPAGGGDHQTHQ